MSRGFPFHLEIENCYSIKKMLHNNTKDLSRLLCSLRWTTSGHGFSKQMGFGGVGTISGTWVVDSSLLQRPYMPVLKHRE